MVLQHYHAFPPQTHHVSKYSHLPYTFYPLLGVSKGVQIARSVEFLTCATSIIGIISVIDRLVDRICNEELVERVVNPGRLGCMW